METGPRVSSVSSAGRHMIEGALPKPGVADIPISPLPETSRVMSSWSSGADWQTGGNSRSILMYWGGAIVALLAVAYFAVDRIETFDGLSIAGLIGLGLLGVGIWTVVYVTLETLRLI